MITYNQLSLADIFSNCQDIYESDKPAFLSILQSHIDLNEIVPVSFRKRFYASTGRTRKYPLFALLWAYAYKIGIVTNGLGIIRHIDFYNKAFFEKHPEITIDKKSDSPDEDKSVHDARLLIPTLQDFFAAHPLIRPDTFLGDSAFDSVRLYKELLSGDTFGDGRLFKKAYIP